MTPRGATTYLTPPKMRKAYLYLSVIRSLQIHSSRGTYVPSFNLQPSFHFPSSITSFISSTPSPAKIILQTICIIKSSRHILRAFLPIMKAESQHDGSPVRSTVYLTICFTDTSMHKVMSTAGQHSESAALRSLTADFMRIYKMFSRTGCGNLRRTTARTSDGLCLTQGSILHFDHTKPAERHERLVPALVRLASVSGDGGSGHCTGEESEPPSYIGLLLWDLGVLWEKCLPFKELPLVGALWLDPLTIGSGLQKHRC